eukprot:m.261305 g.261305  ORF g.261305 m.261305 type:complete len:141 (-) comp15578_c0_seq2:960-1382(-)
MTLCQMEYGAAPHYEIEEFGDRDIEFQYIPSHLYHVMFELAKNSMRAVTERPTDGRLPPIKFLVAKGPQALSIKLSDLGGGVPYMDVPKLFSFFYSTAQTPEVSSQTFRRPSVLHTRVLAVFTVQSAMKPWGASLTLVST